MYVKAISKFTVINGNRLGEYTSVQDGDYLKKAAVHIYSL